LGPVAHQTTAAQIRYFLQQLLPVGEKVLAVEIMMLALVVQVAGVTLEMVVDQAILHQLRLPKEITVVHL